MLAAGARAVERLSWLLEKVRRRLVPPQVVVYEMITGYWTSRALYAAVFLGLPEALDEGPRSVEELAARCDCAPDAVRRLLRALASHGVFRQRRDGRFQHTRLSACLSSRADYSARAFALLQGSEWYHVSFGPMVDSLRTGTPGFELRHGRRFFDFFGHDSAAEQQFHQAMVDVSRFVARAVTAACSFDGVTSLLDVGGGEGEMLRAILERNPSMQGGLLDRPGAVRRARTLLGDGVQFHEGDFFEAIPGGYQGYLMKNILHDWSDELCLDILGNCRRACEPGAHLYLIEMVLPEGNVPHPGKMLDLNMLVTTGGREREVVEFRTLLAAAGFELVRIVPTIGPMSLLESRAV